MSLWWIASPGILSWFAGIIFLIVSYVILFIYRYLVPDGTISSEAVSKVKI